MFLLYKKRQTFDRSASGLGYSVAVSGVVPSTGLLWVVVVSVVVVSVVSVVASSEAVVSETFSVFVMLVTVVSSLPVVLIP